MPALHPHLFFDGEAEKAFQFYQSVFGGELMMYRYKDAPGDNMPEAYAERLITGLDTVDWTDAIKDMQRNWIGKSTGASVKFKLDKSHPPLSPLTESDTHQSRLTSEGGSQKNDFFSLVSPAFYFLSILSYNLFLFNNQMDRFSI